MSTTGRYYIRDPKSGRLFCVEPLHDRNQKRDDLTWSNGGIDAVRGGSISPDESVITPENGFRNITVLPPGISPQGYIEMLLDGRTDQA